MKTASRTSSIPAAIALNMIALMGSTSFTKKQPQDILLKRIFTQYTQGLQEQDNSLKGSSGIEFADPLWFANYE